VGMIVCHVAGFSVGVPVMLVSVRDAFVSPATHTSFLRTAHLHISRVISRIFFVFFFNLVTGPSRSLSLKLSDARVYEPQIRDHLGTTAHFRIQDHAQPFSPVAQVTKYTGGAGPSNQAPEKLSARFHTPC